MSRWILIWFLICSGCGYNIVPPSPTPEVHKLWVFNQSQFDFDELRFHKDADYTNYEIQWRQTISMGSGVVRTSSQATYVTVFRELAKNGPRIAVSTPQAVEILDSDILLTVFDESFRTRTATPSLEQHEPFKSFPKVN